MTFGEETAAHLALLRQSARPDVAAAIERLLRAGSDRELCRVNALAFAAAHGLGEEQVIGGFLHAARLGLFELSWSVLCPSCGGVVQAGGTLKTVDRREYRCAFCAVDYEPTLDEVVEVTFTVNPRFRRIAAHDPDSLPIWEHVRQLFWGTGLDLPADDAYERTLQEVTLEAIDLPPGAKAVLALQLPPGSVALFDPVTHVAQLMTVEGEPTRERQSLSVVLSTEEDRAVRPGVAPFGRVTLRPGPLHIAIENLSRLRALPAVWVEDAKLQAFLGKRRPFLTAKRLLTNQIFRDIYGTDTLDVDQRLKITSLTFLFTDLEGSTELYERVGDLAAYDLVKAHFRVLQEIVAGEAGAIVKTIGDSVMATFPTPASALNAALRMSGAIRALDRDLGLKIGIHEGPCLAVVLNERQDYFGQTVNIASRVQSVAESRAIFVTQPVVAQSAKVLEAHGLQPARHDHMLRGLASEVTIYAIG
jgi:class 3 adenylate cyclase